MKEINHLNVKFAMLASLKNMIWYNIWNLCMMERIDFGPKGLPGRMCVKSEVILIDILNQLIKERCPSNQFVKNSRHFHEENNFS